MMKKLTNSEIEELLQQANLSVTVQRLSLVSYILHADHPTADDVLSWAKQNLAKVNTATVYNTLNSLEKANIIKKIKFPHLSHFIYDNNVSHHYHLLDESSGKLIDLPTNEIEVKTSLGDKFDISSVEVLIKGHRK